MFQVHGIFVSNSTDRLYTVTHRGSFSSIEVFKIKYDDSSDAGVALKHIRSVRSPLFPNGGINDVVEGKAPGELYVTRWLAFPKPATGDKDPQTWREQIEHMLFLPISISATKLTYA
jgi:hypothetical protein